MGRGEGGGGSSGVWTGTPHIHVGFRRPVVPLPAKPPTIGWTEPNHPTIGRTEPNRPTDGTDGAKPPTIGWTEPNRPTDRMDRAKPPTDRTDRAKPSYR